MNLKQRLLRYGIGIFIGVLLSLAFFSGRGCNDWLPEKRIKARMQLDGIRPDSTVACIIRCHQNTTQDAMSLESWLMEAEIDWSESGPRETPQRFVFLMPVAAPFVKLECHFKEGIGWITSPEFRDGIEMCSCVTDAR